MAQAFKEQVFEAVFRAPGQTGAAIDVQVQKVGDSSYTDIPESPLSLVKIVDGEYKFSHTFTQNGVYLVRLGGAVTSINVISDDVSAIKLRVDNLPQG